MNYIVLGNYFQAECGGTPVIPVLPIPGLHSKTVLNKTDFRAGEMVQRLRGFFQRTLVWFLASMSGGLQLPVTPAGGM